MSSRFIFRRRDFDGDVQQFGFPVADTIIETDFTEIQTELNKWLAGTEAGSGIYEEKDADSEVAPTTPIAQNSLQAIIEVRDNSSGAISNYRMPAPNLAKADDAGTPAFVVSGGLTVFNPSHGDYPLLVTQIQDVIEVRGETGAATVQRIYIEE